MYELSKVEEELIDNLRGRVDEHTFLGLLHVLNNDKNYKKMLDYIIDNPKANQSDIMRQHRVIMGLPSYEEILPNKKYALT